jgi:hypothetical protein
LQDDRSFDLKNPGWAGKEQAHGVAGAMPQRARAKLLLGLTDGGWLTQTQNCC